jgi:hypothetical protein
MTDETQAEGAAPVDEAVSAVAEADTSVDTQSGDDAAAAPEAEAEQPKPKKSAQDRIDELTRARRDAEREAEYWKSKALQPETRQETAAEPDKGDSKPDPSQYPDGVRDAAYIEALTDWKVEQAVEQAVAQTLSARTAAEQAQSVDQTWKARQAKAAEAHDDYQDVVIKGAERGDWVCTPEMAAVIKESEQGAEVAYQLAKDPAEARRIAGLSPLAQARELGRIEARLEEPKAKVPPKTVTTAPEPGPTVRGAGGRFTVAADTSDFAAFEAQYRPS